MMTEMESDPEVEKTLKNPFRGFREFGKHEDLGEIANVAGELAVKFLSTVQAKTGYNTERGRRSQRIEEKEKVPSQNQSNRAGFEEDQP